MIKLKRHLISTSPRPDNYPLRWQRYTGPGLRRVEIGSMQTSDDIYEQYRQRFSEDNGRTWSDWQTLPAELHAQGDCALQVIPLGNHYHQPSGQAVEFDLQRISIGDPRKAMERWWQGVNTYFDQMFVRTSPDEERTWGEMLQLRFEDGLEFNPADWGDGRFLSRNRLAGGYDAITTRDGSLVYACSAVIPYANAADEMTLPDSGKPGTVDAIVVFRGRWNAATNRFDFTASKPFWLPRRVSTRGLLEPTLAELRDGRLLAIMRGSNGGCDPLKTPSRCWFSLSIDGGATWTPVSDLRYDDGEQFYVPSSMSRLIRKTSNGKLYWIGNITPEAPIGNGPRLPLVIAEIDESTVSLRRKSVHVLDDRDPARDAKWLALSNFQLLEDRETGALEMYLSRVGERETALTGDAYQYVIQID